MENNSRAKTWAIGSALAGAGLIVGVVAAGTLTANAASNSASPPATNGYAATQDGARAQGGPGDSAESVRPDEHLLTGETADKVKAAALAKYADATVVRIESDSDGVYEAHLRKADGTPLTVEVNKDFEVTGEEAAGPPPGGALAAPNGGATTSGSAYNG